MICCILYYRTRVMTNVNVAQQQQLYFVFCDVGFGVSSVASIHRFLVFFVLKHRVLSFRLFIFRNGVSTLFHLLRSAVYFFYEYNLYTWQRITSIPTSM